MGRLAAPSTRRQRKTTTSNQNTPPVRKSAFLSFETGPSTRSVGARLDSVIGPSYLGSVVPCGRLVGADRYGRPSGRRTYQVPSSPTKATLYSDAIKSMIAGTRQGW